MDDEKSSWDYKPDGKIDDSVADDQAPVESELSIKNKTVSWEAAEFIDHQHGAGWYLMLVIITLALAALVYLISGHDQVATVIVLVLGSAVGVFASHKPATAQYEITATGLKINDKIYKYSDYKSFSIIRDGSLSSINLFPLKRLMPPLAAYFDPAIEKKVVGALGDHLPYEERRLDAIDRLSQRLRL